MIGLDTNVLVRYIAQDDPAQSRRATELIERQLGPDNPGFVSLIVLVETSWVLKRAYRLSDSILAAAIERILQIDALVVQSEQDVFIAMIALKEGKGSFADALIGAIDARAGCSSTATFDKEAAKLPGFELL